MLVNNTGVVSDELTTSEDASAGAKQAAESTAHVSDDTDGLAALDGGSSIGRADDAYPALVQKCDEEAA
eukprot:1862651-Pleurochrysis_carterae.AAC.1